MTDDVAKRPQVLVHSVAAVAVAAGLSPSSAAGDVSGVATLASEYVYRGQAMSGHDPAVSAGIDFHADGGWFAGVWASTVDIGSDFGRRRHEVDYYAGYHVAHERDWSVTGLVMHYSYPGTTGSFDYDFTELIVTATFAERYSIEVATTSDAYGLGANGLNVELRGEWPVATYLTLSATAGRNDIDMAGADAYSYWNTGVSARWSRVTADLRWYDNEDVGGQLSSWLAGSRIVASVSVGF